MKDRQSLYDSIEDSILQGELEQDQLSLGKWVRKKSKMTDREAEVFVNGIIQERYERDNEF